MQKAEDREQKDPPSKQRVYDDAQKEKILQILLPVDYVDILEWMIGLRL